MFFVFSKEKIYTYIVSIVTVFILLYIANGININKINEIPIETSSEYEKNYVLNLVSIEENSQ